MAGRKLAPIHPGEILVEEFLAPLGITQYRLAKDISVPPRRVNEIVQRKRGITADTALRLSRYFGTTDRFWLNLQTRYDLEVERERLGSRLDREVTVNTTQVAHRAGSRILKRSKIKGGTVGLRSNRAERDHAF